MEKSIEDKLDEILSIVKKLEKCIPNDITKEKAIPAGSSFSRKMSVKEFLLQCNPKGDVQKTLAIGYFLEVHEGMASFNKTNIERSFQAIKERPPININDKINMSIRKGHIHEGSEKKDGKTTWSLTPSGEEFVKNHFQKVAKLKN
ncbi:MAG: hypothetical protein HGA31_01165 [Candidatus Moranbacteria bacterium]|nr:hypothetical protein [Candidatus Moranbacteria bacterium]